MEKIYFKLYRDPKLKLDFVSSLPKMLAGQAMMIIEKMLKYIILSQCLPHLYSTLQFQSS